MDHERTLRKRPKISQGGPVSVGSRWTYLSKFRRGGWGLKVVGGRTPVGPSHLTGVEGVQQCSGDQDGTQEQKPSLFPRSIGSDIFVPKQESRKRYTPFTRRDHDLGEFEGLRGGRRVRLPLLVTSVDLGSEGLGGRLGPRHPDTPTRKGQTGPGVTR